MNKRVFTVAVGDPPTLAAVVAARVGPVEVKAGGVHVDGRRCLEGQLAVRPGMRVVVYVDERAPLEPRVVFEDEWLLVVDKPAHMPSQATPAEIAGTLDNWAQTRHRQARLVHRLDREASGLLIISKRPEARTLLQAALESGLIERRYRALVKGKLTGEGEIRLRIARDPADPRKRRALPENDPNGQPACSRYRALRQIDGATLVELQLETGRTHQLRVHLSALGHPIVGDRLYGGPLAERLMLHAEHLTLPHPSDGKVVSLSAPAPFA
jgi:RluA family pseudouridine synthase